ncbi:MAG: HEAT repeat domain-containing protein [Thermoguttaceae bacterium]
MTTTFQLLVQSPNEAAVRALTAALDSPLESIRRQALEGLMARRSSGGKREVLARFDQLDAKGLDYFRTHAARMTGTLRDAILNAEDPLRDSACRAAVLLGEVDLIPALVSVLVDGHDRDAGQMAAALLDLTGRLADQLLANAGYDGRRDPTTARDNILVSLERAIRGFVRRDRPELVEAFALLAPASNLTLIHTLNASGNPAAPLLLEMLIQGSHPAVMGLVLDLLEDPKAPVAAITAVARRADLDFVRLLLRKMAGEPSPALRKNLKRIRSLAWLHRDSWMVDRLADEEQRAALALVLLTRIPREQVFLLIRHLLERGGVRARRAAAAALEQFSGKEANELALQILEDSDPFVQASVVRHLRQRGVAGAMPKLVDFARSPHQVVREAAQECLGEFSFDRFLAAYSVLDDDVRRSTGEVVKTVDPATLPSLRLELNSPLRARRLRGIEVAVCLDLVDQLGDELIDRLEDEDLIVRLEAIAALARATSARSEVRLQEMLGDPNERIREAARRSLDERTLVGRWQDIWESPAS